MVTPHVEDGCASAAAKAKVGELEEARRLYESVLDSQLDPSARSCAVGGLSRLPSDSSVTEWTFKQGNRVLRQITGSLPGGPLALAQGSKTLVASVTWFLTAGLLLVALRQGVRWRREREPGPVDIKAIEGPKDEKGAVALAEVIRERLARAGIYPNPLGGGLGEVAVDVTEVLAAAGDTGRMAKLIGAVRGAIEIKTGSVLTVKADHDPSTGAHGCVLVAQLDSAATGTTLTIKRFTGASYRDAAVEAAYGLYLSIVSRPEVARRTAPSLKWTSERGLRSYHDGLADARGNSHLTAIEKLSKAAELEPANVLVQLALLKGHLAIASAGGHDAALRKDPDQAATHYLRALVAGTRAVAF